jgi:hypothetical protein
MPSFIDQPWNHESCMHARDHGLILDRPQMIGASNSPCSLSLCTFITCSKLAIGVTRCHAPCVTHRLTQYIWVGILLSPLLPLKEGRACIQNIYIYIYTHYLHTFFKEEKENLIYPLKQCP